MSVKCRHSHRIRALRKRFGLPSHPGPMAGAAHVKVIMLELISFPKPSLVERSDPGAMRLSCKVICVELREMLLDFGLGVSRRDCSTW